MNRRNLLRTLALSVPIAAFGNPFRAIAIPDSSYGWIATPHAGDTILVVLNMFGGNDGLNTIVPIGQDEYYKARRLTPNDLSIAPEQTIPIPDLPEHGFHPSLGPLAQLYAEGKVAIVHGVGYPDMDLSHFRGSDIWLSASDADQFVASGWTGRFLEKVYPEFPRIVPRDPYLVEFSTVAGRLSCGEHNTVGHAFTPTSTVSDSWNPWEPTPIEAHFSQLATQGSQYISSIANHLVATPTNLERYPYEDGPLSQSLTLTARMIRSGSSTRLYVIHAGQFDTHHHQMQVHAQQLSELFGNVLAFQREMEQSGHDKRVVILVTSEFGRRVEPTESGTDHGTAAPVFVVGSQVHGGSYGIPPRIDDLDNHGNLRWTTDFRQIYAAILCDWLSNGSMDVADFVLSRRFDAVPIFRGQTPTQVRALTSRSLHVSPNPASDIIECDVQVDAGEVSIEFCSLDGAVRRFDTASVRDGVLRCSVRQLTTGSWFLIVRTAQSVKYGTVVVVR